MTPEIEEGPFYIDSDLLRWDVRDGAPGLPLHLRISVQDSRTCKPLPQAAVDIWHCDALGIYSGYREASLGQMGPPPREGGPGEREPGHGGPPRGFNGPPPGGSDGPPHQKVTDSGRSYRGVQITGAGGAVDFLTNYPGWYQGRDTHIHVKIHIGGHDQQHVYQGGHVAFTGQIAFADVWSDRVARLEPYCNHNLRRTRMNEDGVFQNHASELLLHLVQMDNQRLEAGVSGNMVFTVNPDEIWKEQNRTGGFGGPPPRRDA